MTRAGAGPLIISAMPESEVIHRKGRSAQWSLALGLNLMVLFGLFASALVIGFSSALFNTGALVSGLWLLAVMVSLRPQDVSTR